MLPVLGLGVALWSVASLFRASLRLRLALLAVLWLAVVMINLTLPPTAGLRQATGGDVRGWLVLAGITAVIGGYALVLRRLRGGALKREEKALPASRSGSFSEVELNRYARHIMLREVGGAGQKRLRTARVLVVGAGGLGSPSLLYLAAAGVGTIGVIDDDVVEGSNLQRQVIHTDTRIGEAKVFSAEVQMRALNPFIQVRPYKRRLTPDIAADLIADYDLVLDGTDNFDTRFLVNRVCAELGRPLISGAMTQWEGQLSLYDPVRGGPCYECLFPERPAPGLVPTCAEAGVIAPLPGVIGAMMALEAVKHLTGAGTGLRGRLMIHDALHAETRMIRTKARPGCAACGGGVAGHGAATPPSDAPAPTAGT